jgi:predicted AlkP superfamily pyrophosphatase or phosphodiesterase
MPLFDCLLARALSASICLAILATPADAAEPKRPKVLFLGIDGCRFDALRASETPHLDQLIAEGAYSDTTQILGDRYAGNDTVSGPGWSSILTGVWADKHGVDDNDFKRPNFKEYPHFFQRLKQVRPDAQTISLTSWPHIQTYIVSAADVGVALATADEKDYHRADKLVCDEAVRLLGEKDPAVAFVYFGNVDETGHKFGFHPSVPEYRKAIEETDAHLGEVLKTVRGRKTFAQEDWLVVITSDHGGQGTNHGGGRNIPEIRNSFLIVSGSAAARGKIADETYLVDAPVTALVHLGVPIDRTWKLDGEPKGLRATERTVTSRARP